MTTKLKYIGIASILVFLVAVDLVTKYFLGKIEFVEVIPHLINFETNHGNYGAAWGIFSGKKAMLIAIGVLGLVVFVLLDIFVIKSKHKLYIVGFSMYMAGTLGNLIDRIFLGYVRDFINFSFWPSFPTFNFADCFLCIGAILICVYLLFYFNKDKNGYKNN